MRICLRQLLVDGVDNVCRGNCVKVEHFFRFFPTSVFLWMLCVLFLSAAGVLQFMNLLHGTVLTRAPTQFVSGFCQRALSFRFHLLIHSTNTCTATTTSTYHQQQQQYSDNHRSTMTCSFCNTTNAASEGPPGGASPSPFYIHSPSAASEAPPGGPSSSPPASLRTTPPCSRDSSYNVFWECACVVRVYTCCASVHVLCE